MYCGYHRCRDPAGSDWFEPHFEFRFPCIGEIEQQGIQIELRTAIEPWYVLGEEPAGGATARYVDSSVERMQVKVKGMNRRSSSCHLQRSDGCLCIRRGPRASTWPGSGTGPGNRPVVCIRRFRWTNRWYLMCSTHGTRRSMGGGKYSCRPSRWIESDDFPGQRLRSGKSPGRSFLQAGSHGRID